MSRSGYSNDIDDNWQHIMWRGQVTSAIRGKRGQALLRDLLSALDAMPDKRLHAGSFATADGEFCTLGVLGSARGTKMDDLGDDDEGCEPRQVGERFGIAAPMAQEIMYLNDEFIEDERWETIELHGPPQQRWPDFGRPLKARVRVPVPGAAERRWNHMRTWVASQITAEAQP
jgi:hypothetical protein